MKPPVTKKKTTIKFITLGCSKNLVDSEKVLGRLPEDRFYLMHEGADAADIVVINTCGFINDAKEESIDAILEVVDARKKGLVREVIVTGCLSERYRETLRQEIPEVDAWFGARDPAELFRYLRAAYSGSDPRRFLTTPKHYAYLKISEGCDRTCSFCAIPLIRGKYVSTPVDGLVQEAMLLSGKGVKELILVAQDLSYYGMDLYGKPLLGGLLRALCGVNGIHWLRLHYAYPHQFPDDVLKLMASEPKICKYLDIPLQHISDAILYSMRRGHTKKGTLHFLEKVRKAVPGIALRTTLMVGYPGESDKEFRELEDFVGEIRFDRLGVFTYSPEEGTKAYGLGDPVPESIKQERAEALMELQAGISHEKNRSKVGQVMQVVVDSEEKDFFLGRTEFDSPEVDNDVLVEKAPGLLPGQFIQARITGASAFELHARPEHTK